MELFKKLPDAEFEVMNAVWDNPAPVTTPVLMRAIGNKKGWRAPTLISFLVRLEGRGFIHSKKVGKERKYYPIVSREAYLVQVTRRFLKQYHGGSLRSFLDTLAGDSGITTEQYDELLEWLKSREY